ncbi:MAG: cellulase family glycosylhydrolase [Armatimonadota bacterium]
MLNRCLFTAALILVTPMIYASAESVSIDTFKDIKAWSSNNDGGAISISQGTIPGPKGESTIYLRMDGGSHQWGNSVCMTTIPPNATGVEFDLFVNNALPQSAMYIWFMEKDGDGYNAKVNPNGKELIDFSKGWHRCFIPISSFIYEPRGNKTKEILTIDRIFMGLNYAKTEVHVANLAFRTAAANSGAKENRTADLIIQKGKRGNIAILDDKFEKSRSSADPAVLARTLTGAGFGVTLLKSGDLADSGTLSRTNFDCVVLPYGPNYPNAAAGSIKAYLKSGGSFLSMGGYAFDNACAPDESGTMAPVSSVVTAQDVASGVTTAKWLNTRKGVYGDTLQLEPDQIGVFDPTYHLNWVSRIRAADSQSVIPASVKATAKLQGYAACSMLGSGSPVFPVKWGRHIPIMQAYDSLGRYRGDIGSIALNYDGPYAGSGWGFFGVTNKDLFAEKGIMLPQLPAIVDALISKTFLHSLSTDLACYKDDETVKLSCKVANLGRKDLIGNVILAVIDRSGRKVHSEGPGKISIKPGSTETVAASFKPQTFASDLYRVTAELYIDGRIIDSMETGFAAYAPEVTAGGFHVNLKDNYFRDGDRTVFLSGTNHTGAIFCPGDEDPLVWDRDLARMNENGLNTLRVLHFSPFISDKPSSGGVKPLDLDIDKLPLPIERQLDALVQLCQKHKIILFLSIHDWMNQDLSDAELAAQRRFAALIAARYKDTPGFMIDIQNEPYIEYRNAAKSDELPHVFSRWNDYLRSRYGTDEALKSAWKITPPEDSLGSVPYRMGADDWHDIRNYDAEAFRNELAVLWARENYAGAKAGNPSGLAAVGFLPEYWALNKILCVDSLDFANFHTYSPIDKIRADIKLFDRRFQGKSVSIGEFGSLVDHDKRNHGLDSSTQDYNWFLLVGHYLYGSGGSFMENWDWKDMNGNVFPWGINYTCGGPRKTILDAYRNQSLLFRQSRPKYQPSEVYMVIPLDQMIGGKKDLLDGALYTFVDSMLAAHADFAVIDDRHLDQLPATAKLLVYPFPFSIPDKAYAQIKSFVERGGILAVTGDVSYDTLRQRTRTDRLKELCGVNFISENYPNVVRITEKAPCIKVEAAGAEAIGDGFVNKLGNGKVYYSPVPDGGGTSTVLTEALKQIGPGGVIDSTATHIFRVPEADGGVTYIAVNPTNESERAIVKAPKMTPVEIGIGKNSVGLVRIDKAGKMIAVESHGPVKLNGKTIMDMKGHFAIMSHDGKDLAASAEMLVLPFGGGELDLMRKDGSALMVETGEVSGGGWKKLSQSTGMKIITADETAFDIRIVASKERLPELRRFVASELMLK